MSGAGDLNVLAPSDGDEFFVALLDDDPEDLYERAPCAYLSLLPDGTIIKANTTFFSWTGHTRATVVGRRRLRELLPVGDRLLWETHLAPLLAMAGQLREIALDVVRQDGTRLPVLLNAVAKLDSTGRPAVFRAVLFDATERRAYEQELVQARRRAEESEARSHALARTLQASFLPVALPEVPGVEVGGAYRPAGDGTVVGGDFYDVFEITPTRWGLALGDVCGKGPEAAVVTSLVRHTIRAEALHATGPADVLAAVDRAIARYQPDRFCTAVFALLDREGDRAVLRLVSGGHLLPLRRRDGVLDVVGDNGSILGVLPKVRLPETALVLEPGDAVVFVTDGVTEARRDGRFFEERGLRAAIDAVPPGATAQEVADAVVTAALAFQAGHASDDIAVLVLRCPDG